MIWGNLEFPTVKKLQKCLTWQNAAFRRRSQSNDTEQFLYNRIQQKLSSNEFGNRKYTKFGFSVNFIIEPVYSIIKSSLKRSIGDQLRKFSGGFNYIPYRTQPNSIERGQFAVWLSSITKRSIHYARQFVTET